MTKIIGPCSFCQRRSPTHNRPPPGRTFPEPFFSSLASRRYDDRQAARGGNRGRGGFRGGNRGGRGGGHHASLNAVADDGYVDDGYYDEVVQEGYTEEVEEDPVVDEPAPLN